MGCHSSTNAAQGVSRLLKTRAPVHRHDELNQLFAVIAKDAQKDAGFGGCQSPKYCSLGNLAGHDVLAVELKGKSAEPHFETILAVLEEGASSVKQMLEKAMASTNMKHVHKVIELIRFAELFADVLLLDRHLLQLHETFLGPDNLETVVILDRVALGFRENGELDASKLLLKRSLKAKQEALGPDHAETIQSVENLAEVYHAVDELSRAKQLFTTALEAKEASLGSEHQSTLESVYNLALVVEDMGDVKGAKMLFQRAADGCVRTLGEHHSFTQEIVDNLGFAREIIGGNLELQDVRELR